MDEAKITGITPPVLTLSGMCVLEPPYMRRPDHPLGVLDRHPSVTSLDEDDGGDHERHDHQQNQNA